MTHESDTFYDDIEHNIDALGERPELPSFREQMVADFVGILALNGIQDDEAVSQLETYIEANPDDRELLCRGSTFYPPIAG